MYHFSSYADLALPADSTRRRFLCRKYLGSIKKVPSPEQGFIWSSDHNRHFRKIMSVWNEWSRLKIGAKSPANGGRADLITEFDALAEISAKASVGLFLHREWGQCDLITELDALTEFSAKASVALSLQRRND
jgi:hypothetical protein